MTQFEYVIPFVGIIYGLCATDLLTSIYRLLEQRQKVKFHFLPLVWSAICFLIIINGWWAFFEINDRVLINSAGKLLILCCMPLLTFLFCAAALPGRVPDSGCDMWQYYLANRKLFFSFLVIYMMIIPLVLHYFTPEREMTEYVISQSVGAACLASLIYFKNIWLHTGVAILFLITMSNSLFQQTIVL